MSNKIVLISKSGAAFARTWDVLVAAFARTWVFSAFTRTLASAATVLKSAVRDAELRHRTDAGRIQSQVQLFTQRMLMPASASSNGGRL